MAMPIDSTNPGSTNISNSVFGSGVPSYVAASNVVSVIAPAVTPQSAYNTKTSLNLPAIPCSLKPRGLFVPPPGSSSLYQGSFQPLSTPQCLIVQARYGFEKGLGLPIDVFH